MLENYFENYAILGFYLLVSITVPIGMITLSKLAQFIKVRPSNPSELKESMYECGMKPETERWQGFNIKYYFYALMFVIFRDPENPILVSPPSIIKLKLSSIIYIPRYHRLNIL